MTSHSSLAAVFTLGFATSAHAQATELFLVDFEEHPEGTPITNQYADLGVIFSIEGSPQSPIIATEGGEVIAFAGNGADNPMSSGAAGLTDFVGAEGPGDAHGIVMTFDPPVTSVRLFVIDIDGSEFATLRAFVEDEALPPISKAAGEENTGNGKSTEFFVAAEGITSAHIVVPSQMDYAIDFVSFTRACSSDACGSQIRISQESAPNVGDFDANVFETPLLAFPAAASVADFYAYNVPEGFSWNGQSLSPVAERSHLLIADTLEGRTLIIVHDQPGNADGGRAEMQFELFGDPDGACRSVEDDPAGNKGGGSYGGNAGDSVFTTKHNWNSCCTDGVALSRIDGEASMIVQFTNVDDNSATPTIAGLIEWYAYSADGTQIKLELEPDRRVRLEFVPTCSGDVTDDGVVDLEDLIAILENWSCNTIDSPCGGLCSGDVNEDSVVDVRDLVMVILDWGPCGSNGD